MPPPPPPPPPDDLSPPPGYVGYGTAPTPLARVRPIRGVSRAVAILVGLGGVVSMVGGLVAPMAADRANEFLDGTATTDEFRDAYGPLAVAQALTLAVTLAAAILTMIWMYRISANVRAYGRSTFWAPLFAVFGWMLPPILFLIPFLMLRELWKASTPEGINDADAWKRQPENSMLWAWWIVFGVIPVGFAFVQRETLLGGNVGSTTTEALAEGIQDAGTLSVVSGAVQLVAAIIWILFVRQLAARHTTLTGER